MTDGNRLAEGDLWEEYYTNLHHAYEALREAFAKSGLTQDQLAAKLGVDKGLISRRLNGNENLTLRTMSFMASAMGCRLRIHPLSYDKVPDISKNIGVQVDRRASAASVSMDRERSRAPESGLSKYFSHDTLNTPPRRLPQEPMASRERYSRSDPAQDLNSGASRIRDTKIRDTVLA